jgi:anti-anti-sigma factor
MTTWESDEILHVRVLRSGRDALLALHGELDFSNVGVLRQSLRTVLDGDQPAIRTLTVDCDKLRFLDVAGLSALLDARRELRARQGTLVLRRPTPPVERMLALAAIDGLLEQDGQ